MRGSSDSVMKKVCKATMYVLQFKNTFMHVTNVSVHLLRADLVLGTEGAAGTREDTRGLAEATCWWVDAKNTPVDI